MTSLSAKVAVGAVAAALFVVGWTLVRSRSEPNEAVMQARPAPKSTPRPPILPKASVGSASCPISFEDEAVPLGVAFEHQRGENGELWLPEAMGGGAAWFDLDADGWQDLFVVQGNRKQFGRDGVFRNLLGRRFERLPDAVVPSDPEFGQGVTAGDFDNDGFDDLYVANFKHHRLYRNNGDGTLEDWTAAAGLGAGCTMWGTSAAFADVDLDGFLDVVVCNYLELTAVKCKDHLTNRPQYCGPDSYVGCPVSLLRNSGDGRFIDASKSSKMGGPLGKCMGVVVARLTGDDLQPEVFIANDLWDNFLFQRKADPMALVFQDVGADTHVDRDGEGVRQSNMGVAVGDYDRDGRLDLFSTHYYHQHDTLWRNLGPAGFRDVTKQARLFVPTLPQLSWGTHFLDADGDGWLDLFITCGNINNAPDEAAPYKMTPQFFWNRGAVGDASFDDLSQDVGPFFRVGRVGRGSACCDFDRDGRPDILVVHHHENVALLANRSKQSNAVGLEFVGVTSPRDGLGVRVSIVGSKISKPLVREIHGGGSYVSADARSLLIGLGDASGQFDVEVSWPSGSATRLKAVVPGDWITIVEGRDSPAIARRFAAEGAPR
jgi:hypothetical protein